MEIRAKGKIVNKEYKPSEPIYEWDDPYGYPYLIEMELENLTSKNKLPEIKIPLSELERNFSFIPRISIKIVEESEKVNAIKRLLDYYWKN